MKKEIKILLCNIPRFLLAFSLVLLETWYLVCYMLLAVVIFI